MWACHQAHGERHRKGAYNSFTQWHLMIISVAVRHGILYWSSDINKKNLAIIYFCQGSKFLDLVHGPVDTKAKCQCLIVSPDVLRVRWTTIVLFQKCDLFPSFVHRRNLMGSQRRRSQRLLRSCRRSLQHWLWPLDNMSRSPSCPTSQRCQMSAPLAVGVGWKCVSRMTHCWKRVLLNRQKLTFLRKCRKEIQKVTCLASEVAKHTWNWKA